MDLKADSQHSEQRKGRLEEAYTAVSSEAVRAETPVRMITTFPNREPVPPAKDCRSSSPSFDMVGVQESKSHNVGVNGQRHDVTWAG